MNPLTTCPKVAFWYSGLTLHAGTANTVDGLSYDWQCMTGYEVAHQQLHRLGYLADSEHNDILQEDNTVLNKMLSISTD